MTRRSYDDGDFWAPPVDRKAVTDKQFARAGISRDTEMPEPPPMTTVTRDRLADLAVRDGFIHDAGPIAISPTLAAKLHYRPAVSSFRASDEGAKMNTMDDADAELRSLEEAMHR